MKRLTLALLAVLLLAGCRDNQTYLVTDAGGCAYVVSRASMGQFYSEWNAQDTYSATVGRVPLEDKPTCKMHTNGIVPATAPTQ